MLVNLTRYHFKYRQSRHTICVVDAWQKGINLLFYPIKMSQKTEEQTNRNGWCDVKISDFFGFQYKRVLHHVDLQEIRFL